MGGSFGSLLDFFKTLHQCILYPTSLSLPPLATRNMGAAILEHEVGSHDLMEVTPGRAIGCEALEWKQHINPDLSAPTSA